MQITVDTLFDLYYAGEGAHREMQLGVPDLKFHHIWDYDADVLKTFWMDYEGAPPSFVGGL